MRLLLPAAALVALLLAACGGGGDDPTATPSPTIDFEAAARDALQSAGMTLADLPQFWTEGREVDANFELDLPPQCNIFDPDVSFPDAATVSEPRVFLGSGERQASFTTAVFREEQAAVNALAQQESIVETCREDFLAAIEQAARDEAADRGFDLGPLASIDVALEPIDFPALGDDTRARRASVNVSVIGISTRFDADIIVVRSGRMMAALTYSNFESIDSAEEESIARTMTEKLAAADATLP